MRFNIPRQEISAMEAIMNNFISCTLPAGWCFASPWMNWEPLRIFRITCFPCAILVITSFHFCHSIPSNNIPDGFPHFDMAHHYSCYVIFITQLQPTEVQARWGRGRSRDMFNRFRCSALVPCRTLALQRTLHDMQLCLCSPSILRLSLSAAKRYCLQWILASASHLSSQ